jgi:hypothetical protein
MPGKKSSMIPKHDELAGNFAGLVKSPNKLRITIDRAEKATHALEGEIKKARDWAQNGQARRKGPKLRSTGSQKEFDI